MKALNNASIDEADFKRGDAMSPGLSPPQMPGLNGHPPRLFLLCRIVSSTLSSSILRCGPTPRGEPRSAAPLSGMQGSSQSPRKL